MKTITVKLAGHTEKLFNELKEKLQREWLDDATTSEVIRYAIYTAYCFECNYPNPCRRCYKEN